MWKAIPFVECIERTKIGFKLPKKDYAQAGAYPVVSQEAVLISGYHDNADHVFEVNNPVVVFGDHTQVLKYVDFDFVVGADGVKILKPVDGIDAKFLYYHLLISMPEGKGYSRHYRLLKELTLFIPPLAEQQRIVAKLDAAFAEIDRAICVTGQSLQESVKLVESSLELCIQKGGKNAEKITLGNTGYLKIIDGDRGANYPKKSDFQPAGYCLFLNTKNVLKNGFNVSVNRSHVVSTLI